MSRTNYIVSVEDSPIYAEFLTQTIRQIDAEIGHKSFPSWLEAIPYVQKASLVIIDWVTHDLNTPYESEIVPKLNKLGIPCFILTASPEKVPKDIGCQVVTKGCDSLERIIQESLACKKS